MSDFDPLSVRLGTELGSDLIKADCLLPGCGWTMFFSWGAQRLGTITEVCAQHPCRRVAVKAEEASDAA